MYAQTVSPMRSEFSRDSGYARDTGVRQLRLAETLAEETVSPALAVGLGLPAYEMKFVISDELAREVERLAQAELVPDSHADPAVGNGYRTTTLYCDTAELDIFRRVRPFKRSKNRLRRYGVAPWLYLERKTRWGDRVKKRRVTIPESELALLVQPCSSGDWAAHWFHQQLLDSQFRPVCRIGYERMAYTGVSPEGPVRLTFDRSIRGCLTTDWIVQPFSDGLTVLPGMVICEMKFRCELPAFLKGLAQDLRLVPTRISKYRTYMRAYRQSQGLPIS